MDIIPAIDLLQNRTVRLTQGRYEDATVYADDPTSLAEEWSGQVERLHVVDLDGARVGRPTAFDLVKRMAGHFAGGVQVGGGIRTLETIQRYLEAGAERVVLGTVGLKQPKLLQEAASRFPHRIVLAVDARGGKVATAGWLEQSETPALELLERYRGLELAAILYTDIERDGTEVGPNLQATADIVERGGFSVIASGGIGTLGHIRALADLHPSIAAVVVGRALHEKRFTLPQAIVAARGRSSE